VPIALLDGDDGETSRQPALDRVRISRWFGKNLVPVGVENVGRQKQSRVQIQAWRVQLVTDPGRPRTPPAGPAQPGTADRGSE
jgi:hypothetical protein